MPEVANIMIAWNVTTLIVGFFCLRCIFGATTPDILWKKYASDTEAVCNDNSRATFYIGPQSSNKWIVFFESGGFCASFEECNKRYLNENSTVLMTSTLLPDKVAGRDLLSASKSENPTFYDYTHVLVPYCSSDLWLGLKTNPQKPFHFVNDSSVDNFSFRGHTIFRSVFQDLLQRYNLSKAEEIVLSGSSAGGIGVLNHADWVLNHVIISRGLNATLKSIVDSGWFIDFQDTLEARIKPRFTSLANISLVACQDKSLGYTCCPSASCMIARGYYPASVPLLLISSMYDIFILEDLFGKLEEKGKSENDKTADYVTLVNMYGGAMNESLTTSESEASNLSVFVPACFQHIYLSTSSLWGEEGVFPPSAEFGLGTGKLSHKIQSGTWESTKIQTEVNSSSIKDFITTWVRSRGSPMSMIDSCLGAQCNPTCPAKLLFVDPGATWKQAVQTIILVLSLVITVVSFGLEATFLLYHYYLKWKQRQFLNEGEDSLLEKELPPCRTRERISIACLSLNYSIDVKKQKTIKEKALPEEKPTKTNNATEIRSGRFSAILEEEEDASSDSQCSGEDPGSLPADNLGFDATAEEGLVTTPHYGLGYSPTLTTTKNNLQLERKIGAGSTEMAIEFSNGKEMGEYLLKEKPPKVDSEKMEEPTLREKKILQDVSVYFNPGELVAIMGPSGCGKTTLLDLLTGRRRHGHSKGQVYINGVGLGQVQDWYARKIGYVLQLAVPYYEELTVRQNLFFAAHMRLPKKMSHSRKFERVEQILAETGLTSMADAVVGGSMGGGLSGGQKRRLCVALQMINLPSVLFLDEPTSGLDASSSLELLNHLHVVAESGRLVILTIHQPRLEIFHLFHKILLLCDGQVAYYGEPVKAPAVFLKAYIQSTTEAFRQCEDAPKIDAKNPADTIMDILNFSEARRAILDFYQASGEPQAVQEAIMTAKKQDTNNATMAVARMKEKRTDGGAFNRTFVLEARTSERQTLGQMTYFPFVFFMYGVVTGTVYFGAGEKDGILLMAAYCVYCCSSPLFLSSVLMAHLNKALDIFHLERADGCGRSHENVIQTYVRTVAVCLLPVIVCSAMTYFTVNTSHDLWKFFLVTVISLVLNQTWIAVYMMVICAYPRIAHRVCPMVSAIAGFAGGFLVPKPAMPVGYNLLFYINPQFYGYGAITKVLLKDGRLNCAYDSTLNCISTDGNAVLARFGFDKVNIYENLAIMLGMTALSLILAWLFLEMKYINMNCLSRKSTFSKEDEKLSHDKTHSAGIHTARRKSTLQIITEDEGLHTVKLHGHHSADDKWEQRRKLSSRKERWHSTRKRTEHRKSSITAVIEAELEKVSKTAGVIAKTLHHHHHHNHNYHHQVKPQGHNSIMPKTSNNGPHTLDIKNQQQGLSRPRSITDPIPNMTQVDELKESRPRRISEGSASRVRFQDVLEESDRLDDSFFEQSDTCKDLPHNVNIKNQQQGMSRVRSITDPIPNITRADELEESRPRHLSEGSQPRVRFQDVLESDCLDGDSVFEQSETCKGREQWDLQDKKERERHEALANNTNKDSEGDVAFCCVEVEEVATEEHETRF